MKKIVIVIVLFLLVNVLTSCEMITNKINLPDSRVTLVAGEWVSASRMIDKYQYGQLLVEEEELKKPYAVKDIRLTLEKITLNEYNNANGVNVLLDESNSLSFFSIKVEMKINDEEDFVQYDVTNIGCLAHENYYGDLSVINPKLDLDLNVKIYIDIFGFYEQESQAKGYKTMEVLIYNELFAGYSFQLKQTS